MLNSARGGALSPNVLPLRAFRIAHRVQRDVGRHLDAAPAVARVTGPARTAAREGTEAATDARERMPGRAKGASLPATRPAARPVSDVRPTSRHSPLDDRTACPSPAPHLDRLLTAGRPDPGAPNPCHRRRRATASRHRACRCSATLPVRIRRSGSRSSRRPCPPARAARRPARD